MRYLTIDFETVDPYLGSKGKNALKAGPGWVYALINGIDEKLFKIVGYSYILAEDEKIIEEAYVSWNTETEFKLIDLVCGADALIAHNAQYDVGIIQYVFSKSAAEKIDESKIIYDTKILGKLINNQLDHSLNGLSKKYLDKEKDEQSLIDAVIKYDLYPYSKKELKEKPAVRNISDKKLVDWAKTNMDKIPFEFMKKYGLKDSQLTFELFNIFKTKLINMDLIFYSDLTKMHLRMRENGVRINIDEATKISVSLAMTILRLETELHLLLTSQYTTLKTPFNYNSSKQISELCKLLNLSMPKTLKGNDSTGGKFLESVSDIPVIKLILQLRTLTKTKNDFIDNILRLCRLTNNDRIYPHLQVFGTETGRPTSTGPNILQIPNLKKNEEMGKLCRSIFLPDNGKTWASLDFDNQEGRIQVHFAEKLGIKGAKDIADKFRNEPRIDMHAMVAKIMKTDRATAKGIYLGQSYSQGLASLKKNLGKSEEETKELREQYNNVFSWLKILSDTCKNLMEHRGYIKSYLGRPMFKEPPFLYNDEWRSASYRALNHLVQPSAADQTNATLVECYRRNIPIHFQVYDEINFSFDSIDTVIEVKKIMEKAIELTIPVIAGVQIGNNWADAKLAGELEVNTYEQNKSNSA